MSMQHDRLSTGDAIAIPIAFSSSNHAKAASARSRMRGDDLIRALGKPTGIPAFHLSRERSNTLHEQARDRPPVQDDLRIRVTFTVNTATRMLIDMKLELT